MSKELDDTSKIISNVRKISENFEYPINNKRKLIENLNKSTIDIDNAYIHAKINNIEPDLVKKVFPAYYFPISDSDDFVDKVIEVLQHHRFGLPSSFSPLFQEQDGQGNPPPERGYS